MWMFMPFGFYSVATVPGKPRQVQVRARQRKHLRELIKRGLLTDREILETLQCDYEFRLYCTHEEWADACAKMAHMVCSPKFKPLIKDDKLHSIALRCWSVIVDLYDGQYNYWRRDFRGKPLPKYRPSKKMGGSTESVIVDTLLRDVPDLCEAYGNMDGTAVPCDLFEGHGGKYHEYWTDTSTFRWKRSKSISAPVEAVDAS